MLDFFSHVLVQVQNLQSQSTFIVLVYCNLFEVVFVNCNKVVLKSLESSPLHLINLVWPVTSALWMKRQSLSNFSAPTLINSMRVRNPAFYLNLETYNRILKALQLAKGAKCSEGAHFKCWCMKHFKHVKSGLNDVLHSLGVFLDTQILKNHVYGWNLSILLSPLKIWTPQNFTIVNCMHPVS